MDINTTIDTYFSLEEAIGKHFDTQIYEALQDMRNVKWDYEEGGDLHWIEDDEEYHGEIYGSSVWETEELTVFTLYSDFGGKYMAILKNSNKDTEIEWD
jgi:hypothetical protein